MTKLVDNRKRSAPWGQWLDKSDLLYLHPLKLRMKAAWTNQVLSVQVSDEETSIGTVRHLWVRRHDGQPVLWAEMQRVKNELVGAERVGVEVFPAVDQLVDAAPMYHVYIFPEGYELPFGLHKDQRS